MEKFIKRISATLAAVVMFLLSASIYLQIKGFEYDNNGNFILRQAYAAEDKITPKEIPDNFAFPQDHSLGSYKAPVTIYEYSSFGCTHCADMHLEVLPEIIKKYVDTGLVRVVFVPLPLDKNSMDAALLAECVKKDKYFDFANVLFKHQRDWAISFTPQKVLRQYAKLSGVSDSAADACLKNDKIAARILSDRKAGLDVLGIQGTPSLIVSSKSGNEMVAGFKSVEDLTAVINKHLGKIYNSTVE